MSFYRRRRRNYNSSSGCLPRMPPSTPAATRSPQGRICRSRVATVLCHRGPQLERTEEEEGQGQDAGQPVSASSTGILPLRPWRKTRIQNTQRCEMKHTLRGCFSWFYGLSLGWLGPCMSFLCLLCPGMCGLPFEHKFKIHWYVSGWLCNVHIDWLNGCERVCVCMCCSYSHWLFTWQSCRFYFLVKIVRHTSFIA